MPGSSTGLLLIIVLFIRLKKMASFDLNVKHKQLTAPEVSEWNLASLTAGIVLFSCWPLVWESLFSWYICCTHMPQHHGKSSNTEPALWILQCAGPVHEEMGSKENQCAIEKMCNTHREILFQGWSREKNNQGQTQSSELRVSHWTAFGKVCHLFSRLPQHPGML